MICQPCTTDDHDNCAVWTSVASLGMRDRCSCYVYRSVHFSPAPLNSYHHPKWEGDEWRDYTHDTGEDEFETWIARNEREYDD